ANGAAITFADADFTFGRWNADTETIDAASGSDIDAVEVTARCTVPLAFGAAFGKSTTAVAARATARCASDPSPGIIGLNSIQMQNGAMTDSYRSTDGAYAFATHRTNGDIASNGSIQLTNSSQVYGDAHRLSGQTVNSASRIVSPGQVLTMSTPLSYPVPTIPPGTTNLGNYTRQGTGSTTLTAGNYRATKFEIKDQHKLTISGVVTVYVNGDVTFQNQAKTMGNPPGNFRIRVVSTGHTLKIQDGASVEADIAAPGVNVTLQNQAQLYGSVVGKTLIVQDQAEAHFDESIVSGSGSTGTTLVR
ncbi:MAG: TadG family pilus assembly protein, partial [Tepidisphaeraceae bacterium]